MNVHTKEGMTVGEVKKEIMNALQSNKLRDSQLSELFLIFFDISDVWAKENDLMRRISNSRDPVQLEEAARIMIDPMLYYVSGDDKYYVYR